MEQPYNPATPLPDIPLKTGPHNICVPKFTAVLLTTAKRWKQPKCVQNKMWSIQTMKCHSALKRKETLTPAIPWMNPEDVMLSEITVQFHLHEAPRTGKNIESRNVASSWRMLFSEDRASVWENGKF